MAKLSINAFVAWLVSRWKAGDGYIMGARGQDPKKWAKTSWWFTQYSGAQRKKALQWREESEQVHDCQGMVEGYINQLTGSNIDVRARNNYATWCDPKGTGVIPPQYRVPGAAVFKAGGGAIHHVGYLVEPVDPGKPQGDWYVIEAKGVMHGVVRTRLLADKAWDRWGLMTKYFDYDAAKPVVYEFGDRALKRGMIGDDVRAMQGSLIDLGYNLGKWGADGDFGIATEKAVIQYQKDNRLPADGIVDDDDFTAIRDALLPGDPDEPDPGEPEAPKVWPVHALDLSSHNSAQAAKIDWEAIKRDVAFLILRCGCTRTKTAPIGIGSDAYFERWAQKCNEMDIPFWAYYYAKGGNDAHARAEAQYAYDIAARYNPVGYCLDVEEKGVRVETWFREIKRLGARRTMIYIGHNWVPVYDLPTDPEGFISVADAPWIPRYGKNDGTALAKYLPKYPCDLWQYTSVFAHAAIPDKTLDCNIVTGQRHSIAWFRGEE